MKIMLLNWLNYHKLLPLILTKNESGVVFDPDQLKAIEMLLGACLRTVLQALKQKSDREYTREQSDNASRNSSPTTTASRHLQIEPGIMLHHETILLPKIQLITNYSTESMEQFTLTP